MESFPLDAFFEILPIAKMILAREVARANDVVEGEAQRIKNLLGSSF